MAQMAWPSPPLEVKPASGFRGTKVECVAVTENGARLFAGSSDGSLVVYSVHADTPDAVRSGSVELRQLTQLAGGGGGGGRSFAGGALGGGGGGGKAGAVAGLVVVDAWRLVLGIVDGQLAAYDARTCSPV